MGNLDDYQDRTEDRNVWILDVDDTLYPMSCGLHNEIKGSIVDTYNHLAGIDNGLVKGVEEILARQGLSINDVANISQADLGIAFPSIVQAIQELYPDKLDQYLNKFYGNHYHLVQEDRSLTDVFNTAEQKGIRVLFYTNGPGQHVEEVMKRLGFDPDTIKFMRDRTYDLIDSINAGRGKPTDESLQDFLSRFELEPQQALFVDDGVKNLKPAARIGIKPIWAWTQDGPPTQQDVALARSINARRIESTGGYLQSLIAG